MVLDSVVEIRGSLLFCRFFRPLNLLDFWTSFREPQGPILDHFGLPFGALERPKTDLFANLPTCKIPNKNNGFLSISPLQGDPWALKSGPKMIPNLTWFQTSNFIRFWSILGPQMGPKMVQNRCHSLAMTDSEVVRGPKSLRGLIFIDFGPPKAPIWTPKLLTCTHSRAV